MRVLERTPRAELDLLQIWVYVADRNLPAAEKLLARLEATIALIASGSMTGERINHIAPGLRRFSVGEYVLMYRPIADGVRLLRVVHGSREVQGILDEIGDESC